MNNTSKYSNTEKNISFNVPGPGLVAQGIHWFFQLLAIVVSVTFSIWLNAISAHVTNSCLYCLTQYSKEHWHSLIHDGWCIFGYCLNHIFSSLKLVIMVVYQWFFFSLEVFNYEFVDFIPIPSFILLLHLLLLLNNNNYFTVFTLGGTLTYHINKSRRNWFYQKIFISLFATRCQYCVNSMGILTNAQWK